MIYVALYLLAIVTANLTLAALLPILGPWASVWTAFAFIGADLTLRDGLHDAWHGRGLAWKMLALILAGSVISYVLNDDVARIAVASAIAFGGASLADWTAYSFLGRRPWLMRTTGSNLVSAAVDSILFPTIAFGVLDLALTSAQYGAKVIGGAVWALLLLRRSRARHADTRTT